MALLKGASVMTNNQLNTLNTEGKVTAGDNTVEVNDNEIYYAYDEENEPIRLPTAPPTAESVVAIGTDGKDKLIPVTDIQKRYIHNIELAVYESETSYANCYLTVETTSSSAISVDYLLTIFAASGSNSAGDTLLARIPCTGYVNHSGSYRGVQCIERIIRTSDSAEVWRIFAVDTSGVGQYHMSSLNVTTLNTAEK